MIGEMNYNFAAVYFYGNSSCCSVHSDLVFLTLFEQSQDRQVLLTTPSPLSHHSLHYPLLPTPHQHHRHI